MARHAEIVPYPCSPSSPAGRELSRAAQPACERRQAADLSSADATAHFEAEPDHPRLRRQHRRPVARGPRTAPSSSTGAPGMAGKPPIGRGARCHPAALSSCIGVAGGVGTRRVRPSRPGSSMCAPPCSRQCRVVVAAQRVRRRASPCSTRRSPTGSVTGGGVVEQARKDGYTETILGRRRYLTAPAPDRPRTPSTRREMAERMALNAPIQGSAAQTWRPSRSPPCPAPCPVDRANRGRPADQQDIR